MRPFFLALALLLLAGCEPSPEPIRYGEDVGAHCRMTISDARFGAELLTTTGKAYTFDSIECLAAYVQARADVADQTHSLWVTSYADRGALIALEDAFFVHSPGVRSPMGRGLAAFGPETTEAEALAAFPDAQVLTWDEVLALVRTTEVAPPSAPSEHADRPRSDAHDRAPGLTSSP